MKRILLSLPVVVCAIPMTATAQVDGAPAIRLDAVNTSDDHDLSRRVQPLDGYRDWLNVSDFPIEAFDLQGLSARYVGVDVIVNDDGTLAQCSTNSSDPRNASFAQRLCDLIRERGHFRHALDSDGKATRGQIRMIVSFLRYHDGRVGVPAPPPPPASVIQDGH